MIILLTCFLIIFSVLIALLNNPINALFCLAACYFLAATLLLVLNIEFLALALIFIYLGALLMLFLFMLMLSNIKEFSFKYSKVLNQVFSFCIINSIVYSFSKFIFLLNFNSISIKYNFENIYLFNYLFSRDLDMYIYLYTDFFIWFFLLTLILFISIIGALLLLS